MTSFLPNRKALIPHAIAVVVMLLVAAVYCLPELSGEQVVQTDIVKYKKQSAEIRQFREDHGEEPLWTSRVFSGATTFFTSTLFKYNIVDALSKVMRLGLPPATSLVFLGLIGFYILLISLGVHPWLALAGSIGYGLSSNLMVSLMAGHNTKVMSIAYLAPSIGGLLLALRGRFYAGVLVSLIFVSLLAKGNHYQIMYYFMLTAAVISVVYFIKALQEKTLPQFFKAVAAVALVGMVGVMPNMGKIYNTYVHSKETIRGGQSELSNKKENERGGLDRNYAFSWSEGPLEVLSTIVPSMAGGSSGEALPKNGAVAEQLNKFSIPKQQKERILGRAPLYVGGQPFVQGTIYFGAGFIFLFILALMLVQGPIRTAAIATGVLFLVISFGKHAEFFNGLLFDYLPFYNKFRTPSMALAVVNIVIPLLGMYGLNKILQGKIDRPELMKKLKLSVYVMGGIMLMLLLYGLSNDWTGPGDGQLTQSENSVWAAPGMYEALLEDRKGRFLSDWLVSTLVIAVTVALIFFQQQGKLKFGTLAVILSIAYGADMWRVDKRYFSHSDFISQRQFDNMFSKSPADEAILKDPSLSYRVIDVSVNPWTDGNTCYLHQNVGGHDPAKLQRYQDLIEYQLTPQMRQLNQVIRQSPQGDLMFGPEASDKLTAYNMLNTKYFIIKPNDPLGVARNPHALGNAWFVSSIRKAGTSQEEIDAIAEVNPSEEAIIHKEFEESLWSLSPGKSPDASIVLDEFEPNYLKYTSNNQQEGLAVFSEIYYENGWTAKIDNEEVPIYRANYVLRALKVPAGEHTIEFSFRPESYATGNMINATGSSLYLIIAALLGFMIYRRNRNSPEKAD